MSKVDMQVDIDGTLEYFQSVREEVGDLEEVFKQYGDKVVREAKENAPVRTGALRDSLDYVADKNSVAFVAGVDYASYVELGTSKMDPQPYLFPALVANEKMLEKEIRKAIKNV